MILQQTHRPVALEFVNRLIAQMIPVTLSQIAAHTDASASNYALLRQISNILTFLLLSLLAESVLPFGNSSGIFQGFASLV